MIQIGFLPCFSRYIHKKFPIKSMYERSSYVEKVKKLVSVLLDSPDQITIKEKLGSYDLQTIRPNNSEGKRIIKMCESSDCNTLLKIDYGNNPFRIVLGLSTQNKSRNAYIFIIDTKHKIYKKRKW